MNKDKELDNLWFSYIKCSVCGHVERRFALVPYNKCEKCGCKL